MILFGNIFHNLGAVNKEQLPRDLLDLFTCNLKLAETQIATGFSTLDNSLNLKLKILLLE